MDDVQHEADDGRASGEPAVGVPRWVKVFGLVVVVLLVLMVVVMLVSGGRHGPGRHLASGTHPASMAPIAQLALTAGARH